MDIPDTCVSSHASKRLHCRSRIRVQKWTDTLWNLAKLNRTTSIAGNSWWYQAEMVTRISEVHRHPPSCRLVAKIRPTICCFGRCDLIWHSPRWVRFETLELIFIIIFDNTYELLTIQIDRLYLFLKTHISLNSTIYAFLHVNIKKLKSYKEKILKGCVMVHLQR